MLLAADLIKNTPDNSLTLFDKGFDSLGLLHSWQSNGTERHWLLPLKKHKQYIVIQKLGNGHEIIEMGACPKALKKWPNLPKYIKARVITEKVKGKNIMLLTSMLEPLRYPKKEIVGLYKERWEIELGYREMKQNKLTL